VSSVLDDISAEVGTRDRGEGHAGGVELGLAGAEGAVGGACKSAWASPGRGDGRRLTERCIVVTGDDEGGSGVAGPVQGVRSADGVYESALDI
jgi:hypothetical protein